MRDSYDVIVMGGGTAGAIAAIQAGRAGARVLLVEKNGVLGGTMTVGGINAPAHFFAWGKPIIAGIGWELFCATLRESGQPIPTPEFTVGTATPRHLWMERHIFAALCDQAACDAGVELLFHAMPAELTYRREGWHVTVCTKTGLRKTRARTVIDATGDANAVQIAGFDVVTPAPLQPATLAMICAEYDVARIDADALHTAARAAIEAGELKSTDIAWEGDDPAPFLKQRGNNANHFRVYAPETSEGRTELEVEAHRATLRVWRFFRKQPGLETFRFASVCSEAAVRESVVIRGKGTVTAEDYESGRRFEDALCYAYYPVDEHCSDGAPGRYTPLAPGTLPTIPRGALLPERSRFLIVAGRCLSCERSAHAGLRVECPCMAMGQAAGAMAALSARSGVDPEDLPLADIYKLLREHAAIVPG